jgi:hypothetical protein
LGIGGEKRDSFRDSLREEHSIKRIFVQRRKAVDVGSVLSCNRELDVSIVEQASSKNTRVGVKVIATQRVLDRDFPDVRRAEIELVLAIAQVSACPSGQAVRLTGSPEKELGIE